MDEVRVAGVTASAPRVDATVLISESDTTFPAAFAAAKLAAPSQDIKYQKRVELE